MARNNSFNNQEVIEKITERLTALGLYKIILFGSTVRGEISPDSDVDLLVVTEDEFLPKDFSEKNKLYLRVSQAIFDIQQQIPVDLIVHTKAMHNEFIELGSMFAKKIQSEGVVLYEKNG